MSDHLADEVQALRAAFFREIGTASMQLARIEQTLKLLADRLIPKDPRPPGTRGPKPGNGKGSVQKLGPGRWRARAVVKMKPVAGPTRKTRKMAQADLDEMRRR